MLTDERLAFLRDGKHHIVPHDEVEDLAREVLDLRKQTAEQRLVISDLQEEQPAYLRGAIDGMGTERRQLLGQLASEAEGFASAQHLLAWVDEMAKRGHEMHLQPRETHLRVGRLVADLNCTGSGSVTIDGIPLPVCKLVLTHETGSVVRVTTDLLPMEKT